MRRLIETRLAAHVPVVEPGANLLANVEGPISKRLRAELADPAKQAAVLVGLVDRAHGLTVLLTERAAHLSNHAGQVSFPGGRLEPADAGPVEAALREAHEEVGLAVSGVSVAGCLADHATGTGFIVTPVVGFIPDDFIPIANPDEVQSVFEVPLDFVLDAANYELHYRERFGSRFRTYELRFGKHLIWGATAGMLVTFRNLLNE